MSIPTYSAQTTLEGPSRGSPDVFEAILHGKIDRMSNDPRPYWRAMYRLCRLYGFRAELLIFQSWHETAQYHDNTPWTSDAWSVHNPAGIGITNDTERKKYDFGDGATAAGVHVARVWIYVHGPSSMPDELAPYWDMSPRQKEAIAAAGGKCKVLGDLNGRWAYPGTTYAQKIAELANRYADRFTEVYTPPATSPAPIPPKETPPMAGHTITWPGLPGGPITFSFPFSTKYMVPAHLTLNRPGIKARKPRLPLQHENGNPNAYAAQDSSYLATGAGGRQASWHATVDHMEGFANLPADEIGWHAGDGAGPGNYQGFAIELSQRSQVAGASQWRQARKNAAEVMGRVMARLDGSTDWGQHAWYMNKNCPQYLRDNATHWAEYKADANAAYADERARMKGAPAPTPVDDVIHIGDTIKAIVPLNLRQGAATTAPVVKTFAEGEEMVVNDRYVVADGYGWLPVKAGSLGGFVAIGDSNGRYIEKVRGAPTTPPPATYAPKMPVNELLMTDLQKYDTAAGISTVNELDFVFVADVIEFTTETVAAQHGGKGAPPVKAPYVAGERAIAAWLVETVDNGWQYLLAGGDDEWVRVPYANTKRVSDAPLLGDDKH